MSQRISVLMSIYDKESPDFLAQSLESLRTQTHPADEILIVKDGPLRNELEAVLDRYTQTLPIVTHALDRNQGTGAAVRIGVERCSNEWIARMDSDDICVPSRFEKQAAFIGQHPELDVVGGSIQEFALQPADGLSVRKLPAWQMDILAFAKFRNPVNQVTALFRRSAALRAGNYRTWIGFEDYDLWVRMLLAGSRFHNLEDVLVHVRCGNGMQNRRGGWSYARREAALFWEFKRLGFLTAPEALRAVLMRCPSRLLPTHLRSSIYRLFLRKRPLRPRLVSDAPSQPVA